MVTIPGLASEIHRLSVESMPNVLETMFFTTAVESDVPCVQRCNDGMESPCYDVFIRFFGAPSGLFRLRIPTRAARELAVGFLGLHDEDIGPMEASQVACEMANMLCGSVLSRAESETGFELSAPVIAPPGSESADSVKPEYKGRFVLDIGSTIEVVFRLDEFADSPA